LTFIELGSFYFLGPSEAVLFRLPGLLLSSIPLAILTF
jgi:hypothetical protein